MTSDGPTAQPVGVNAEDVTASIEMILGRTPDQSLVDYHLGLGFPDRAALGRYMLGTQEFRDRYAATTHDENETLGYWAARAHAADLRRQRMLSFGSRSRGILASTTHGLFVVDPEDSGVSTSLLQSGSYGDDEVEFAASLISPDSNVLIVGTHIGILAIPLAGKCAHLVGLEANPNTYELLAANVRLSGLTNIEIHHAVIGETDGAPVEFLMNRENSGGSKIMPASAGEGYMYDAPTVWRTTTSRIDTLLGPRSFDLIIMDIEGSEIFALRGMPEILKGCRCLAIEFRPHHLIEVANLGIDDFEAIIGPLFNWMFIPSGSQLVGKDALSSTLQRMFLAGECHDVIYFFKEKPETL